MPLYDSADILWTSSKGATNNTSAQTVISDPGTGLPAFVCPECAFGILNEDTASATVILRITGGTSRVVERIVLAAGEKFVNSAQYVVIPGETLTVELGGTVTTNQLPWNASYYQHIA